MKPGRTSATVAETANLTHIGERTIRRWITARILPTYLRSDGKRVVVIQEVLALEHKLRTQSKARPRAVRRRIQLDKLDKVAGS